MLEMQKFALQRITYSHHAYDVMRCQNAEIALRTFFPTKLRSAKGFSTDRPIVNLIIDKKNQFPYQPSMQTFFLTSHCREFHFLP
jgi:hypothetical protein